MYEGDRSEILYTTKFNENSDLGTTYLGRIDMTRSYKIKAYEKLPVSELGCTVGKY